MAYVVGTVDAEKDKRDSDVWMVSWDGTTVRLTSSRTASHAALEPGRPVPRLSRLAGDEDEKKKGAQVWLLNRAGGEAQKLTDVKGGVSDFAWSPDSARSCSRERRRSERRAREEGRLEAQDVAADRHRSLSLQADSSGTSALRPPVPVRRRGEEGRQLTSGDLRRAHPPGRPTAPASRSLASAAGSRSHERPRPVGHRREARRDGAAAHDVQWPG